MCWSCSTNQSPPNNTYSRPVYGLSISEWKLVKLSISNQQEFSLARPEMNKCTKFEVDLSDGSDYRNLQKLLDETTVIQQNWT